MRSPILILMAKYRITPIAAARPFAKALISKNKTPSASQDKSSNAEGVDFTCQTDSSYL